MRRVLPVLVSAVLLLVAVLCPAVPARADDQQGSQEAVVAVLPPSAWVPPPMYCGGWMAKYKESNLAPLARAITGGIPAVMLGDAFTRANAASAREKATERSLFLQSMQQAVRAEYGELASGAGMRLVPFTEVDAAVEAALPSVWQEEGRSPKAIAAFCEKTGASHVIYADMLGYGKQQDEKVLRNSLGFTVKWNIAATVRTEIHDRTGALVFSSITTCTAREGDEKSAWLSCVQDAVRSWRKAPAPQPLARGPLQGPPSDLAGHWVAEEFADDISPRFQFESGSTVLVWVEYPGSPSSKALAGLSKSLADQLKKRGFAVTLRETPRPTGDALPVVTPPSERAAPGLQHAAQSAGCRYAIYASIMSDNVYFHGGWRKPTTRDLVLYVKVVDATTGDFWTGIWDDEEGKLAGIIAKAAYGK